MRNHLGGLNAAAAYAADNLDLAFGGSWSYYSCPHWGELDWMQETDPADYRSKRWYDNDVDKQDANVFVRANWTVARGCACSPTCNTAMCITRRGASTTTTTGTPPRCSLST
ncbi:MAG: hypothetical protein ACLRMJ_11745 [Alistipes finegoldii]